jgi:uncharacterized membrane protein YjfL (UPF0719 family)
VKALAKNGQLLGFVPISLAADNLVGFTQMLQRAGVFTILEILAARQVFLLILFDLREVGPDAVVGR